MHDDVKQAVCKANLELIHNGLVTLTFGNVSGRVPDEPLFAIKPSGVAYDQLTPDQIVLVDFDGKVVEGDMRPSSDTPTHLALYRAFDRIAGVVHTHSTHATIFAQALRPIPCFGTTHADHFHGEIPVTRAMSREEINSDYELNTGRVIVERFEQGQMDPLTIPAALVASHGPFAWGPDPHMAVENAIALEEVARTALGTLTLEPDTTGIHRVLLDKHFLRKHGPGAYYGQK